MSHVPVLLHEALEGLDIQENDTVLDGTLGSAGHAKEICRRLGADGTLIGIDQDAEAVAIGQEVLHGTKASVHLAVENFRNVDRVLDQFGIRCIDKALFDLGVSSRQLEDSGRGFTFQKNEPLLMTLKTDPHVMHDLTAGEVVNHFEGGTLLTLIRNYGEERYAKRIVSGILRARTDKPIETTDELVRIIEESVPVRYRHSKIHPATRTFQALRMTVNEELEALSEMLEKTWERLKANGRMAIISFHSIEDRAVKNFFREKWRAGEAAWLTKKPIVPGEEERRDNPRSRSAKLRIIQKVGMA